MKSGAIENERSTDQKSASSFNDLGLRDPPKMPLTPPPRPKKEMETVSVGITPDGNDMLVTISHSKDSGDVVAIHLGTDMATYVANMLLRSVVQIEEWREKDANEITDTKAG